MKKLYKIFFILPVLYVILMPVYLAMLINSMPCSTIALNIKDSAEYHFVTRRQLLKLVYGNSGNILGQPVRNVSVADIENRIRLLREIKEAEAYISIDGTIHVYVDQRDPVIRVIPDSGGDFFIDKEGVVIRKRNLYTPRLHIVGGNVIINSAMLNGVSILDSSIKRSVLKDIFYLVRYINDDDFWAAQIDQIYVDDNDEIDLIPRVGNHILHLGTTENFEGKLRNLEAFYEKVLPEVGWNKYSLINLEFKDQIVCKRR